MKKLLSVIISVMLLFGFAFAEGEAAVVETSAFDTEKIKLFKDMIQDLFYKDVTDEDLYKAALKGMFQSLDPYSNYYTKSESEVVNESVSGTYQGIGIKFEGYSDYMRIVKVFTNTPAYSVNLMAGDYIVGLNGEDIKGWTSTKVASLIKGEPGTTVELEILRGIETFKVTVTRANIQAESCDFKVFEEDIGCITIEEFNVSTAQEISKYLHSMRVLGLNKLIIDLRDNPGGYVDQAVLVARNFVPQGVITSLKYKNSAKDVDYMSYLKEPYFKVVVLVNGNSASSSEILSGAIKDSNAGILIGTKTYGKGVFQNMYNLKDGGMIKVTTGAYYTPSGVCIDKIGIEPNIVVEDEEMQLIRAIEEVKKL